MIRTLALSLFVGYTTTLPPPHQRLSSDGQAGSYRFVRRISTDKRPCGKFEDGFSRTDASIKQANATAIRQWRSWLRGPATIRTYPQFPSPLSSTQITSSEGSSPEIVGTPFLAHVDRTNCVG
jgi:hypothetical protein